MNILIDLPEETLEHYSKTSKLRKQSRKAMIEQVLIQHVQNVDYNLPEGLLAAGASQGGKPYNPMSNPIFKSKNKLK